MKTTLIRQPAGLGDIFFCQKIAKELVKSNYRVIWPVLPQFSYLAKYFPARACIYYPTIDSEFDFKNYYIQQPSQSLPIEQYEAVTIINLQTASWYYPFDNVGVMYPKYKAVGLSFENWKDYFTFYRDKEREQKLWDYYKLNEGEKYIFVNKNFASPPNIETNNRINIQSKSRVIEMEFIEGVNLFDWAKILENAEEIHTVETSICYLVEKLQTTNKLFLYPRNCVTDFAYCKQIYQKPWNYQI